MIYKSIISFGSTQHVNRGHREASYGKFNGETLAESRLYKSPSVSATTIKQQQKNYKEVLKGVRRVLIG